MIKRTRLLFGLLTCMTLPCVGSAQNPQPAPPQETHPPLAPPNASQPPPEQIAPAGRTAATGKTTLSDKLSQQQGTLKPPEVDPDIQVPIPSHTLSTTPVIPPPGTPGGDQKIVPK